MVEHLVPTQRMWVRFLRLLPNEDSNMKREIFEINRYASSCCPGHDKWPNEKYSSNRSTRARSRDIAKEHRYVRRIKKMKLKKEIDND
jgi:hypothetical protein